MENDTGISLALCKMDKIAASLSDNEMLDGLSTRFFYKITKSESQPGCF